MDSVVIRKAVTIERGIQRIRTEYGFDPENLENDFTRQDAIILNIQRAIQAALDMGLHIIKSNRWGMPGESRQIFEILEERKIIDLTLASNLKRMVGFRNLAVHDYQNLNLEVIHYIIKERLKDLLEFSKTCLQLTLS